MKHVILVLLLSSSSLLAFSQTREIILKIQNLKEYRDEIEKMKKWAELYKEPADIELKQSKTDSAIKVLQMNEVINHHYTTTVYTIAYNPATNEIVSINRIDEKDQKRKVINTYK